MACDNCEKQQEDIGNTAYYRWKNADIAMEGCNPHLREVFNALNAAQNPPGTVGELWGIPVLDEDIRECQKCKRTLPNNLINALMTGGEGERKVQDVCALCGLALRNLYLGVPDAQFTGELAQQFYERTVEYYKKTNQLELPADHNCQADEVALMCALAKTYAKTKPKN